jgi:hypothetical protein
MMTVWLKVSSEQEISILLGAMHTVLLFIRYVAPLDNVMEELPMLEIAPSE